MKSLTRNLFSPLSLILACIALLIVLLMTAPAFALTALAQGTTVAFTAEQQFILTTVVASFVVAIMRLVYEWSRKTKFEVPDIYMQWFVVIVASICAWLWFPPMFPEWPALTGTPPEIIVNLLTFLADVLKLLLGWFLYAIAAYELVIRHVKDKLGQLFVKSVYGRPRG